MLAAAGGGLKKLSPFLGLCSSPPQTASEKGEIQMRAQEEQKQLPPLHSVARGPLFKAPCHRLFRSWKQGANHSGLYYENYSGVIN